MPGVHLPLPAERARRRAVIQHAGRWPSVTSEIVPDKAPDAEDVAIAQRLLDAFTAASEVSAGGGRQDLWAMIAEHQKEFLTLLRAGDAERLAGYLCNVSRQDASMGITQGNLEYERIRSDPSYRDFLAVMAKDKLVSLAEAVGSRAIENPEQGAWGEALRAPVDDLVAGIARELGVAIIPPDVDGGMLKITTSHGRFGERDANAIFTAWLLTRVGDFDEPRICEIGAGSGRVAYWRRRLGPCQYTIIDLQHVNVVQGFYLLKTLPEDRVRLYGEPDSGSADITIWPSHAIDQLADAEFDLVLNQDSMPEMSRETVDEYLDWIAGVCRGLFVSINHESRPAYGENLRHVSVPDAVGSRASFSRRDRYPYWLRRGYAVEVYRVLGA
jgi:hypothetical protein